MCNADGRPPINRPQRVGGQGARRGGGRTNSAAAWWLPSAMADGRGGGGSQQTQAAALCQPATLVVCGQYLSGQSLYARESGDGSLYAREQSAKDLVTALAKVFESQPEFAPLAAAADGRADDAYECSQEMLVPTLCLYIFPACDAQSAPTRSPRPLPLCKRDCEYVASACSYQLDELQEYFDNCAPPHSNLQSVV